LRGERTLGVLSALDRGGTGRTTLQELELLMVFATQAAVAIDASEAARPGICPLGSFGGPR